MSDLIGQTLGNFSVFTKLGQGGAVYKARDTRLQRMVALKIIPPQLVADTERFHLFQSEARAAAQLEHTNLVPVYDIGASGDTHFIVMELIGGESLAHRLARKKTLGTGDAVAVALFVAKALAHAWQHGRLAHRDLRLENIFIARDGEIKLGDLGLAACRSTDATNPATAYYTSPEQGRADRVLDFRSDIYGLGCVLFHLLTGAPPYVGDTPDAVIQQHLHAPPPNLRAVLPDCPAALGKLLARMLAKNPDERPASYKELLTDLWQLHKQQEGTGVASAAAVAAPRPPRVSHQWVYAALGVVGLVIVAALLWRVPWKSTFARVSHQAATHRRQPSPSFQPPTQAVAALPAPKLMQPFSSAPPKPPVTRAPPVFTNAAGEQAENWRPRNQRQHHAVARQRQAMHPAESEPARMRAGGEFFGAEIARLPPEEQVQRVVARLKQLNPGYDGSETHEIQSNRVVVLALPSAEVANIGPVHFLTALQGFLCGDTDDKSAKRSQLEDLRPLHNLPLQALTCTRTEVSNLAPLQGMPLRQLWCKGTRISDLRPLRGLPLVALDCQETPVRDLAPLRNKALQYFFCDVAVATNGPNRGVIRSLKQLKQINGKTPSAFWVRPCAYGDFSIIRRD